MELILTTCPTQMIPIYQTINWFAILEVIKQQWKIIKSSIQLIICTLIDFYSDFFDPKILPYLYRLRFLLRLINVRRYLLIWLVFNSKILQIQVNTGIQNWLFLLKKSSIYLQLCFTHAGSLLINCNRCIVQLLEVSYVEMQSISLKMDY